MDAALASKVVVPADAPSSLLDFLAQRFPQQGRALWQQRLQQGKVLDAAMQPLAEDGLCYSGQLVYYFRELTQETDIPFALKLLFENERIVVIDKPHFLPTSPAGKYVEQTALRRLQRSLNLPELTPAHRLDRLTAGVLLFCKQPQYRNAYQELFRQQAVQREYEALAPPLPQLQFPYVRRSRLINDPEYFFRSCEAEGQANSETHIEILAQHSQHWHYLLRPQTGRKHQLRVHMAALGAPILGDDFYPQPQQRSADDFSQPLQLLARSLAFKDPVDHQQLRFVSERQLRE